jgi:hypothetical protein
MLNACTSVAPSSTPGPAAPTTSASSTAPAPTPSTKPTPPPALVGTWLGLHNCRRIIDIMTAAGMSEQALLNAAESGTIPAVSTIEEIADRQNPCAGATDKRHWHFFTASGEFGSLDMNRQRVDDGFWTLADAETVAINGTPFHFQVDGDELRLEAIDVGKCPANGQWCPEAWKLMVAMPGMVWRRD